MNNMLKTVLLTALLAGCSDSEVGDVSLGVFTLKDIKVSNLDDEKIPGVTCHIASIEADFSLSDLVTVLFLVVKRVI